jgi:hypothetical protein
MLAILYSLDKPVPDGCKKVKDAKYYWVQPYCRKCGLVSDRLYDVKYFELFNAHLPEFPIEYAESDRILKYKGLVTKRTRRRVVIDYLEE